MALCAATMYLSGISFVWHGLIVLLSLSLSFVWCFEPDSGKLISIVSVCCVHEKALQSAHYYGRFIQRAIKCVQTNVNSGLFENSLNPSSRSRLIYIQRVKHCLQLRTLQSTNKCNSFGYPSSNNRLSIAKRTHRPRHFTLLFFWLGSEHSSNWHVAYARAICICAARL